MTDNKIIFPLGSIVLLEEGLQQRISVGRGESMKIQLLKKMCLLIIWGAIYPTGVNPEIPSL